MTYTIEQKYKFLLSLFYVADVDYWEKDALVFFDNVNMYFQYDKEENSHNVDKAIEWIMKDRGV